MPLFLFLQSFHHASSNMCPRIVFCESSVRCWWSYPSECGHVLWFRGVRGVYVSRRFARVLMSTHLVHRFWYVFSHGFQRRHGSEPLGGFGGVQWAGCGSRGPPLSSVYAYGALPPFHNHSDYYHSINIMTLCPNTGHPKKATYLHIHVKSHLRRLSTSQ